MDVALGTGGKGSLKEQILSEMKKTNAGHTVAIQNHDRENKSRLTKLDISIDSLVKKMDSWKELQTCNKNDIVTITQKREQDQKNVFEAIDRQFAKSCEQIGKLDSDIKQ